LASTGSRLGAPFSVSAVRDAGGRPAVGRLEWADVEAEAFGDGGAERVFAAVGVEEPGGGSV
jgi:hypothetical protein